MIITRRFAATALLATLPLAGCVPYGQYANEQKLLALSQQLNQQLQSEVNADQAKIALLEGKLKVTLENEILFPEGGWEIRGPGERTLNKIVPTLQGLTQTKVVVDGYTDNEPIGPELRGRFPSNWQLSSARADGVVQYLARKGVNPNLLSAQGFGDTQPVAANTTPAGRAKNRRIEVTLVGPGT